MQTPPYRMPTTIQMGLSGSTAAVSPMQLPCSLTELPDVRFVRAEILTNEICADMYGDLPYGLFVLPNGVIKGSAGYIFTQTGAPIVEQNADFLRKKRFLRPRFEGDSTNRGPSQEIEEVVSLASRCDAGFWHWMMDSLPKVVLAEASGFKGIYLLPPPSRVPWATESLALLGIEGPRCNYQQERPLTVKRLYIPTYFCGYNAHHNPTFMGLYRQKVLSAVQKGKSSSKERIVIGRRDSSKVRRVVNSAAVEEITKRFGFKIVYFEDLSLRDQITLAANTEAIVGSHGSGLSHSLFMPERSLVIELFPFNRRQSCDCYETLAHIPHHRYRALESASDQEGDIEVDCGGLLSILEAELVKPAG